MTQLIRSLLYSHQNVPESFKSDETKEPFIVILEQNVFLVHAMLEVEYQINIWSKLLSLWLLNILFKKQLNILFKLKMKWAKKNWHQNGKWIWKGSIKIRGIDWKISISKKHIVNQQLMCLRNWSLWLREAPWETNATISYY